MNKEEALVCRHWKAARNTPDRAAPMAAKRAIVEAGRTCVLVPKGGASELMDIVKHVKIFADGADMDGILTLYRNPLIKGLYHQSDADLMKPASGDYQEFARRLGWLRFLTGPDSYLRFSPTISTK